MSAVLIPPSVSPSVCSNIESLVGMGSLRGNPSAKGEDRGPLVAGNMTERRSAIVTRRVEAEVAADVDWAGSGSAFMTLSSRTTVASSSTAAESKGWAEQSCCAESQRESDTLINKSR